MIGRIRILYVNCPSLDTDALSQLLLSQNNVQKELEFSVFNYWLYSKITKGGLRGILPYLAEKYGGPRNRLTTLLARKYRAKLDVHAFPELKKEIDRNRWFSQVQENLKLYDTWLKSRETVPVDCDGMSTIIITQTPISDGFFSLSNNGIGIISIANWSSYFKPVRPFDYLLVGVQRLSLRLACAGSLASHYETKGCLWDYCQNQPDARIGLLNGYICEVCNEKLESSVGKDSCASLRRLISNEWVGHSDDKFSPAAILSKIYSYDLSRSKTFNSRIFSRIRDAMPEEMGKVLVDAIRWSAIVILTMLTVSCFPGLIHMVKKNFNAFESDDKKSEKVSEIEQGKSKKDSVCSIYYVTQKSENICAFNGLSEEASNANAQIRSKEKR